jgi:PAS domain S-box-containing protein
MIYESIVVMTLFDVVIISFAVVSLWILFKDRSKLTRSHVNTASSIVAAGLSAIGLFYLADLLTMFVLPLFITTSAAMAVMKYLHLEVNWIVIAVGTGSILIGFTFLNGRLLSMIDSLERSEAKLKREISAHQETEKVVQESEERFRLAFEDGPIGMAIIGLDYRFVRVNKALCEMLGYSEQELTAHTFVDITHSGNVDKDVPLAEQVFKGEVPTYALETRYIAKNQEVLWINQSVAVIRDQDGNALYGLGVMENITGRKRAEELIRLQRQREVILHDINLATTSTLDLRAILDRLLEGIENLLPYSACAVRILDRETGKLERLVLRDIDEKELRAAQEMSGVSFSDIVLEKKAPLVIRNVQIDSNPVLAEFYAKHGLVSYLGLPLIAKEQVLGVLSLLTKQEHDFTNEETGFLTTLASQAAMAIHNSQLYEQVEQRTHELSALQTVTATTTQSLDLKTVLNEVIKKITEIFHFDATRIYLLDPGVDELHLQASYETKPEISAQPRVFPLGEGHTGKVVESGEPVIYENIQSDPRYQELSSSKTIRKAGFSFFAVFPIKTRTRTVGTINCIGEDPRRLTVSEIQLITSMAGQIAVAVANANLLEDTRERTKQLSALYSVASVVGQSLDIEAVLRNVIQKVLDILNFDAAYAYLLDRDKKERWLVAYEGFPAGFVPPSSHKLGQGVGGKVLETGNPVFFEDIQNNPEYLKLAHAKTALKAGFRGLVSLPIIVKTKPVGVIYFFSKATHRFSANEADLIHAIIEQLGIAVENIRLYEETKTQAVQMERLNKVKDEFLSVMSHELRTPLNVVVGYTEMIKDGLLGEISPKQETALGKVINCSKDQLSMITNILEATRLQAEPVKAEVQEVNLGSFLEGLRLAYNVPLGKEVSLNWDYPSDLPAIKTDGKKLKHILQNLIGNAIKFTEKGNVTLSARHVPQASRVDFRVTDTGIGIPEESLPHIFDMFRQIDSSETRAYGGVGLGLYIVKKFTELLGGKVEAECRNGNGSTFTVTIPCERDEA